MKDKKENSNVIDMLKRVDNAVGISERVKQKRLEQEELERKRKSSSVKWVAISLFIICTFLLAGIALVATLFNTGAQIVFGISSVLMMSFFLSHFANRIITKYYE